MKIIAALFARFTRKKAEEHDVFEQRLQALKAPAPRGLARRVQHSETPILFRREMSHA